MTTRSLAARTAALSLVAPLAVLLPASAAEPAPVPAPVSQASAERPAPTGKRVLAVSVDGLNVRAITRLGRAGAPNLHRLLAEGATTLNARTAYERTETLPNHTTMVTGRRIDRRHGGHGVTWNVERPRMTVQKAAGHRVGSVFTAVRKAGLSTALFTTKSKFRHFQRSWPRAIGRFELDANNGRLVRSAIVDLTTANRAFTFLHTSLPDAAGHQHGGMSEQYLAAVRRTDALLGRVLAAIDAHPLLKRELVLVLTADHGFRPGSTHHEAAGRPANYKVPFLVWGAGVAHGDLYALNPGDYRDPGNRRPAYRAVQPIRNGDVANLATDLLGLPAVRGSLFGTAQSLDVS
ncbi:MAG TPA: alkaline phosphatase family protein [Nocardioides sp.]|uniref:alkaline phosphatase family protein n=1 Tax=Nocardioides sp. TaxID=35761 RepID=UPI002EDA1289